MLVVACFCGAIYTVIWGKAMCPTCGEPAELDVKVELEDDAS